jgi:hypothetical protein
VTLRFLIIAALLYVSAGAGQRMLRPPIPSDATSVLVLRILPDGTVEYIGPDAKPSRVKLAGIVAPSTGSKESSDFIAFANYMGRGNRATLVPKTVGRESSAQFVLSDGRDLGYLCVLGRYCKPAETPPTPTTYLAARRQLDSNTVESLAAKPQRAFTYEP